MKFGIKCKCFSYLYMVLNVHICECCQGILFSELVLANVFVIRTGVGFKRTFQF